MRDYLLGKIHQQYDARREAVTRAFQSRAALELRQQKLRNSLNRIVGELPDKAPLNARVTGIIEELILQRDEEVPVPALLVPPASTPG